MAMATVNLMALVEQLEENIEDLEDGLEPLLASTLSATTRKLPVLDRAKLYVLIVYSIESLLFSYLRLNGVQAKEHPVFRELTRVKQYFEKIKEAETGAVPPRQNLSLNKQAAGRIIKHALAGNDEYDTLRAELEAKEKLLAARRAKLAEMSQKRKAEPEPESEPAQIESADLEEGEVDEDEDAKEDIVLDEAKTPISNDQPVESSTKKKISKRHKNDRRQIAENTARPE